MFKYNISFFTHEEYVLTNKDLLHMANCKYEIKLQSNEKYESGLIISFWVILDKPIDIKQLAEIKKEVLLQSTKINCDAEYCGPDFNVSQEI